MESKTYNNTNKLSPNKNQNQIVAENKLKDIRIVALETSIKNK